VTSISIIVPTFGRADRIERVARNIHGSTTTPHEILFVYESEDEATKEAIDQVAMLLDHRTFAMYAIKNIHKKNYAGAVQSGFNESIGSLLFLGADDLDFSMDWDTPCVSLMKEEGVSVVGTNDLHNQGVLEGWHATHYLIDRSYLSRVGGVIDVGPGSVNYLGYDHNYPDTEFIETASHRGVFRPCLESVVEHRHFVFGLAAKDSTYEKGYAKLNEDAALFESRRHLWAYGQGNQ